MKLSSEEKKKEYELCDSAMNVPGYPYNLKIRLDPEQVQKLGITDLDVGKKLKTTAMIEVVEKEKREVEEGKPNICLCIQICELDFEKSKKSDAKVIYGE